MNKVCQNEVTEAVAYINETEKVSFPLNVVYKDEVIRDIFISF